MRIQRRGAESAEGSAEKTMTAQEWKAKGVAAVEVVELALPSGMVISARRPGPMQFAAWDLLPTFITEGIRTDGVGMSDEEVAKGARLVLDLLMYCCLEPRISTTPADNEIDPRDIPEADWLYIVRWAMRLEEAATVRRFRGRGADGSGSDGSAVVFRETVGVDGNRGPGAGTGVRPGGGAEATGVEEGRG